MYGYIGNAGAPYYIFIMLLCLFNDLEYLIALSKEYNQSVLYNHLLIRLHLFFFSYIGTCNSTPPNVTGVVFL